MICCDARDCKQVPQLHESPVPAVGVVARRRERDFVSSKYAFVLCLPLNSHHTFRGLCLYMYVDLLPSTNHSSKHP